MTVLHREHSSSSLLSIDAARLPSSQSLEVSLGVRAEIISYIRPQRQVSITTHSSCIFYSGLACLERLVETLMSFEVSLLTLCSSHTEMATLLRSRPPTPVPRQWPRSFQIPPTHRPTMVAMVHTAADLETWVFPVWQTSVDQQLRNKHLSPPHLMFK